MCKSSQNTLTVPKDEQKQPLDSSCSSASPGQQSPKGTDPFTVPQNTNLVGGWFTKPSEKYAQVKLDHETPNRDETKKHI